MAQNIARCWVPVSLRILDMRPKVVLAAVIHPVDARIMDAITVAPWGHTPQSRHGHGFRKPRLWGRVLGERAAATKGPRPLPPIAPPALGLWRNAALFEGASPEAIAAIAQLSRPVRFSAGQILFDRGDAGDQVFALGSGRIKLALLTAQGRELVLRHAEAGDFLGELAFLDGTPRSAMAVAVTAGEGVVLDRRALEQIAPALRNSLLSAAVRYICQRLRETTDHLESIALYGLSGRLARFFLLTLRQLHGDDLPPNPRLRLSLTQGELAAVLGASRPKVNRALQELEEAGALAREDNGIFLCQPKVLLALAEDSGG